MGKKPRARWMVRLHCEHCRGPIERSIQDLVDLLKKDQKAGQSCPHCGARITYEKGLTPQDLSK